MPRLDRHFSDFDVVAIGASLGGFQAIGDLLAALPADLPAAIIFVQHTSHASQLPALLKRRTALPVQWAAASQRMLPANVYVAPPNYHLTVTDQKRFALDESPKVNFVRPSIDVLFQSVAEHVGERAIGVVLTGLLYDGARGAEAIKAHGGRVIVQDPTTAFASSMPRSAMQRQAVNYILPIPAIASALITLTMIRGAAQFFSGSMLIGA